MIDKLTAGLALCCALTGIGQAGETGGSFRDDFRTFNHDRWLISNGWSNGDWMNCDWSKDAVAVEDGKLTLRIEAKPDEPVKFRCGEIQSHLRYGFGTFEVLVRTGKGSGLNAAFFTYIGPVHHRPHHEIDVEVLLHDTARVSFNTYVDGKPRNGQSVPLQRPADAAFTHFAFVWRPEGIIWYANGQIMHRAANAPLPKEPQKIYASLWSSSVFTDWMGEFDSDTLPQETGIEWIAFTRLGDACQFEESVVCADD